MPPQHLSWREAVVDQLLPAPTAASPQILRYFAALAWLWEDVIFEGR